MVQLATRGDHDQNVSKVKHAAIANAPCSLICALVIAIYLNLSWLDLIIAK